MIDDLNDVLTLVYCLAIGGFLWRAWPRRRNRSSIPRDEVAETIDSAIRYWRGVRDFDGPRADEAPARIDEAQHLRASLLGTPADDADATPTRRAGRDVSRRSRNGTPTTPPPPPKKSDPRSVRGAPTPERSALNALLPACPDCGAKAGQPCRWSQPCIGARAKGLT